MDFTINIPFGSWLTLALSFVVRRASRAAYARRFGSALMALLPLVTTPAWSQGTGRYEQVLVAGKKMACQSDGLTTRAATAPVVIFEGGVGAGTENFAPLFAGLSAQHIAWFTYARAGLYGSEADATVRTDEDVVQRLHALLQARQVAPPYLLVGHSLGGALVRLFTARYPTEVAGLVLIDPTNFLLTTAEDEQIKIQSASALGYRALVTHMLDQGAADPHVSAPVRGDMQRLADANRTTYFPGYSALPALPDIPVTILLAYNSPIEQSESELFAQWHINGPAWFAQVNRYRVQHFAELLAHQHHSALVLLPGYVHVIHHMNPGLVVTTIRDVYTQAQTTSK